MNEAVRLSLVIPVHDQFDKLSKALTSALAALRYFEDRWELIVVDDASSSDVGGLLPSDVILLRNPARLGFGPTANRGMAAARGEFCCLLNSDMYVDTDFFVASDFLCSFAFSELLDCHKSFCFSGLELFSLIFRKPTRSRFVLPSRSPTAPMRA